MDSCNTNTNADTAYRKALPFLARKPLTSVELRNALARAGLPDDAVARAIARLRDDGYLDDRKLALHYILARTERLGHGPGRLLRELEKRGVERQVAQAAWNEAVEEHGLLEEKLLQREVRRKLQRCGGKLDLRNFRRVYNALLRAGFEPYAIRSELDPFRTIPEISDDGIEHDLP
jgi:regulatory protein